jgi:hypothetical protein
VVIIFSRTAAWKKLTYAIVLMIFNNFVIAALLKIAAQRKYRQMRQ